MAGIVISPRQTPVFRAKIATEAGELFDPEDLATAAELAAEGVDRAPVSWTVYRAASAVFYQTTGTLQPVAGFERQEIDAGAILDPATVAEAGKDYNFSFLPVARVAFPFETPGAYYAEFTIYPKTGAAIVWRVPVTVQ